MHVELAFLEDGPEDGPLVICVHGFPDTAHTWSALLPALGAAGFRAVAPFTRGIPPSPRPEDGDYSVKALGEDVLALMDKLGRDTAFLVGHDWGAAAVFAAAHLAPERIVAMVTLTIPHSRGLKPGLRSALRGFHFFTFLLPFTTWRMARNDFAAIDRTVRRWAPTWDDPDTTQVKEAYRNGGLEPAMAYYRAIPKSRESGRLLARKTETPTLTIAGRSDGAADPALFEGREQAFLNDHELQWVDAGHFPQNEQPEAVNALILEWFEKYRDAAPPT